MCGLCDTSRVRSRMRSKRSWAMHTNQVKVSKQASPPITYLPSHLPHVPSFPSEHDQRESILQQCHHPFILGCVGAFNEASCPFCWAGAGRRALYLFKPCRQVEAERCEFIRCHGRMRIGLDWKEDQHQT